METKIKRLLAQLGVRPCTNGFRALAEGIALVLADESLLYGRCTSELYPKIGEAIGCSGAAAGRAIERAVEQMFADAYDPEFILRTLDAPVNPVTCKYSAAQMIGLCALRLRGEA